MTSGARIRRVVVMLSWAIVVLAAHGQNGAASTGDEKQGLLAVRRILEEAGDAEILRAWVTLQQAPENPNKFVNVGNLVVRAMERHSFLHNGESSLRKEAAALARQHFMRAVELNNHFGAHYSLGLLWKLYPDLALGGSGLDGSSALGYDHMCKSFDSFVVALGGAYQELCRSIVPVRATDEALVKESLANIRVPLNLSEDGLTTSQTYLVRLGGLSPIYIQGRDYVMHDLHGPGKGQATCHIITTSSGCYVPLFRQFSGKNPRTTQVPLAASILGFSSGEYYHWLLESLPRLLLLRRELTRLNLSGRYPLLIPMTQKRYIIDSIDLLLGDSTPWPFSDIVPADSNAITAVRELVYVDWTTDQTADSSSQLWAPPGALRLVRSTFVPRSRHDIRDTVVYVARRQDESRRILNEGEVLAALRRVCAAHNVTLKVFEGSKEGFQGGIEAFSRARVVVGVHGAALANVVFSAPGTSLVEIALPEPEFREYEHVSLALGLHYRPLHGLIPPSAFESRVYINGSIVAAAVDEILSTGVPGTCSLG